MALSQALIVLLRSGVGSVCALATTFGLMTLAAASAARAARGTFDSTRLRVAPANLPAGTGTARSAPSTAPQRAASPARSADHWSPVKTVWVVYLVTSVAAPRPPKKPDPDRSEANLYAWRKRPSEGL